MSKKWTWAREENQELWMNGQFDSKEETIKQAKAEINSWKEEDREVIYVGRCVPIIPGPPLADNVLDRMADSLIDESHPDLAGEYYQSITVEEEKILQDKLDKAWYEWLEETNNYPEIYTVTDIEKVKIK